MHRMDRLFGYLLLFQRRGWLRAQDFAARFEVSERTVYRDIQALCEAGVPILAVPGEGYQLMEGYYLPPVVFSEAEARALFLAVALLTGLSSEGATKRAAALAIEKIRAILPQATRTQMETLLTALSFYMLDRPPLNMDDPLIAQLQQAIEQHYVVHLSYHALNTNQLSERDVEPLRLDYIDKSWQLRAYCRLKDDQRYFRLDRIDQLTLTSEIFAPRALTPASLPVSSWRVVVRFDASIIRWVREEQHFSFVCEIQDENTSSAKMVYQVSSFQKILGWLLRWGDQMEVLEPDELRTIIMQTAAHLMAHHQAAAESVQNSS